MHTGGALYQIQNGKLKLIAYASKRLPEAARNYSITELQICGLAMNIVSFAHLLRKVGFDAMVDHLDYWKCLSAYSFNLYYVIGKDMILK